MIDLLHHCPQITFTYYFGLSTEFLSTKEIQWVIRNQCANFCPLTHRKLQAILFCLSRNRSHLPCKVWAYLDLHKFTWKLVSDRRHNLGPEWPNWVLFPYPKDRPLNLLRDDGSHIQQTRACRDVSPDISKSDQYCPIPIKLLYNRAHPKHCSATSS